MRHPYWHDATATLYTADPREVLADMPAGGVDCVVTSPPPWTPDDHHDESRPGGHQPTPALYVAQLRRVLAHTHRVLADEGTLWLHLSDRHAPQDTSGRATGGKHARRLRGRPRASRTRSAAGPGETSLMGLPWQIAFALQDDGWIIRNAIVWHHPDGLPHAAEPFTDRLAYTYELIFLLVKQKRYHFDLDPIRQELHRPEVAADPPAVGGTRGAAGCLGASARRRPGRRHTRRHGTSKYGTATNHCRSRQYGAAILPTGRHHAAAHPAGRNPGDVWTITTPLDRLVPFAALPVGIPLRCIAAGCRPGGTVLDPFAGAATTGLAARQLGRSFIGIEPDPAKCDLAKALLSRQSGPTGGEPR